MNTFLRWMVVAFIGLQACLAGAATEGLAPFGLDLRVTNESGDLLGSNVVLTLVSNPGAKTEVYAMSRSAGAGTAWGLTNTDPQLLTYNADPIIDYAFGVKNNSAGILNFSFSFLGGYTGGPYSLLTSNHSSVASSDATGAVVTVNTFPFIHNPQLDGATVAGGQIGDGCLLAGGVAGTCDPGGPDLLVPVSTLSAGIFGVNISFKLSPGDSYSLLGEVELAPIPEPGTWALLLAGLFGFVAIARRRMA